MNSISLSSLDRSMGGVLVHTDLLRHGANLCREKEYQTSYNYYNYVSYYHHRFNASYSIDIIFDILFV